MNLTGQIICISIFLGCAILFYGIGIYAAKCAKPMCFWAGTQVDATKITDVKAYNLENSLMWKRYALWDGAAGIAGIWSPIALLVISILSCTIGLWLLVRTYNGILRKYYVQ